MNDRWRELRALYLPIVAPDSIWRYSRRPPLDAPEQGWKLHVSATILSANETLEAIAPWLAGREIFFKAPADLPELLKINSGIHYHYSQIGKFVTVYPQTDDDAVFLAEKLHLLTARLPRAPVVPFDFRLKPDSAIYYRYGAFKTVHIDNQNGTSSLAMRDEKGDLIVDERESKPTVPAWASNPFVTTAPPKTERRTSPLNTTFRVFRALSQRGKGGVYAAFDCTDKTAPRLCIVKEGRKNGEVEWDGRDGYWRVRQEERVLKILHKAGVRVPRVYSVFETNDSRFLVLESIKGETLHQFLAGRKRRLSIKRAVEFAAQLAMIMADIHQAGWVWRDCKPDNVIVGASDGRLRPIDFEGASAVGVFDWSAWGTPPFAPDFERERRANNESNLPEDLHALGALLRLLLEGGAPENADFKFERRGVPKIVREITAALLDPIPNNRPTALTTARQLQTVLLSPVCSDKQSHKVI